MRSLVGHLIRASAFNPGLIGAFLNPFYLARRALWAAMAEFAPGAHGRMLDVGCGSQPYRTLFDVAAYVGLEIDTPEARGRGVADEYYDGGKFPFADASFGTVLCNQVLEHVFEPDAFVRELCRVLEPSGQLILTVPFVWDEHEQPHDYARYSSFGLHALLSRNGLEVVEHRKLLADSSVLFQMTNAYLYKVVAGRSRLLDLMATAMVMGPLSLLGRLAAKVLPGNPDLYLDHVVVARPRSPVPAEDEPASHHAAEDGGSPPQ